MKMLSVLQGMVENEGRMVIRASEWILRIGEDKGKNSNFKGPTLSKTESMGHPKHS
jgi:hypothetical protein